MAYIGGVRFSARDIALTAAAEAICTNSEASAHDETLVAVEGNIPVKRKYMWGKQLSESQYH
jgi:hypothetical protein